MIRFRDDFEGLQRDLDCLVQGIREREGALHIRVRPSKVLGRELRGH